MDCGGLWHAWIEDVWETITPGIGERGRGWGRAPAPAGGRRRAARDGRVRAIPDRGGDHRGDPPRDPGWPNQLPGRGAGLRRPGPGLQRRVHATRHPRRCAGGARERSGPRRRTGALPHVHRAGHGHPSGLRPLQRHPAGPGAHGAHAVRPDRAGAVRHGGRRPERGAGERAQHAQPARRAVGDLPGCLRRASLDGGAARGLPRRLRGVPAASRRPRAGAGAGRAVRRRPRPGRAPDVLRSPGLQGRVRHEGHAHHDGGGHRLRRGCAPRRCHRRRPAAAEGRHHLRQGERHRVQRRHRQSRRAGHRDRPLPGLRGAEHVGRAGLQPLRHRTFAAGLELRVGRRGLGEPRRVRLLRADRRLLQGTGVPERRGEPAHDQGA